MFARGTTRQHQRHHGGRVGAAEDRGQQHAAAQPRDALQDVTAVGHGAHGHDDEPRPERVDRKRPERPVGEHGKDDGGQQQELREGQDLVGRHARGQGLQAGLQFQQQQVDDNQRRRDPEVVVLDEGADEIHGQAGHLRGRAAESRGRHLAPVRQHHEAADHGEADRHQRQPGRRDQRGGVAEQADQRIGADTAKGVLGDVGLVFLAFDANQEREEEHQDDLGAFGRQQMRQVGQAITSLRRQDSVRGGLSALFLFIGLIWPDREERVAR